MVMILLPIVSAYKSWDVNSKQTSFDSYDSSHSSNFTSYTEKSSLNDIWISEDVKAIFVQEPESFLPSSQTVDIFADTHLAGLDLPLIPDPPSSPSSSCQDLKLEKSDSPAPSLTSKPSFAKFRSNSRRAATALFRSILSSIQTSSAKDPKPLKKRASVDETIKEIRSCNIYARRSNSAETLPPSKSILKVKECTLKKEASDVQQRRRIITNWKSWELRDRKYRKKMKVRVDEHLERTRARLLKSERSVFGWRKGGNRLWVDKHQVA